MSSKEMLFSESGVSIDSLVIITGTGNKIGFELQLVELNIYEDIFSSCVSGNLLLQDTYNFIEKNPICGQEWLCVRFSKPGVTDESGEDIRIEKLFRIYKIEKVIPENERKMNYVIHFTNEDLLVSSRFRWCKGYKLIKPEQVIKDIFSEGFAYDSEAFKQYFEKDPSESATAYNMVIPNLHYFEAINYVTAKARNNAGAADFLFFENGGGYRFESIAAMQAADTVMSIRYKVKNVTDSADGDSIDPYLNSFSPIAMHVEQLFDLLTAYPRGEFGVQADTLDLSQQTFYSKAYGYEDFREKYKKEQYLNPHGKIPVNDWGELPEKDERIAFHRILSVSGSLDSGAPQDRESELRATRTMQLASLTQQRIKLHMPGNALLRAGRTIDLKYPNIQTKSAEDNQDTLLDKYLAAKYLISTVRHRVTLKTWDSYVELVNDSLPNELPAHFAQNYQIEAA